MLPNVKNVRQRTTWRYITFQKTSQNVIAHEHLLDAVSFCIGTLQTRQHTLQHLKDLPITQYNLASIFLVDKVILILNYCTGQNFRNLVRYCELYILHQLVDVGRFQLGDNITFWGCFSRLRLIYFLQTFVNFGRGWLRQFPKRWYDEVTCDASYWQLCGLTTKVSCKSKKQILIKGKFHLSQKYISKSFQAHPWELTTKAADRKKSRHHPAPPISHY